MTKQREITPGSAPESTLETATLGGGCFWCLEGVYQDFLGVESVVSGYAGGHLENPSYEAVCTGTTGHAEVVQLQFRPEEVSYETLLRVFFTIHDPTTPDRQGGDVGSQYRSVIFTHSPEQKEVAQAVMAEISESGMWDAPLVTQLESLDRFWEAEPYHHRYFQKNPEQGYCRMVVAPKVAKARKSFAHLLRGGTP